MTLEKWESFIKFAINVARKHPTLFQTTEPNVLREYLSFHQLHGNLFFTNGAFAVIHPILNKEDEFDWTQPESNIYKMDVLYSVSKAAFKNLLCEIARADRKMEKVYGLRRNRIIEWNVALTKRFLYGKEKGTYTASTSN